MAQNIFLRLRLIFCGGKRSLRLPIRILGVEIRQLLPKQSLSQIDIQSESRIPSFEPTISMFFEAFVFIGRRACEQLRKQHSLELFDRVSSSL
jgi:hypothetical protein